MNKDFSKAKLLSFTSIKQLKALLDLAKFIEDKHLQVDSKAFQKLKKYHAYLETSEEAYIQKLNKEFEKVNDTGFQFQIYLMNLERLLGQSSKDYQFLVDTTDGATRMAKSFPIVCILDSVRSAHNVGAIIRTSECFGIEKVYTCGLTPSTDSPHVIKTAMGSEKFIECEKNNDAKTLAIQLKGEGYTIWSIETSPTQIPLNSIKNVPDKLALVFGHEQFGVSRELLDLSDSIVPIQLYGAKNSLNVSIAHGIVLNKLIGILQRS